MLHYVIEDILVVKGRNCGLALVNIENGSRVRMAFDEVRDKLLTNAIHIDGVKLGQYDIINIPDEDKYTKIEISVDRSPFVFNKEILKINRSNLGYKPRDAFESIVNWVESGTERRVLGLYGLRRTGKTVLLMQICEKYIKAGYNVAYALVSKMTDFQTFSDELNRLVHDEKNMPYIIAIDEITYADWFIPWANELSDKYASGPKIILAGTHSLALRVASNSTLYGRMDLISTTYISYKEFSRIMDDRDIMTYIRFGGVLSSSREIERDGCYNYVQTAIVENLEGTFNFYERSRKAWPELWKYIDEDGSLSSIVQQFIMSSGESVMLSDLRRGFKDRNLSSALSLIPDIKLSKYIVSVLYGMTANRIGVDKRQYDLGTEILDELISLLLDIEAITLGKIHRFTGEESNRETCEIMFNQPGLRYEQAMESIRSLNLSASELGISEDERGKIIEKLIQDTEGRLLEQVIWLNVMSQAKRVKDCEAFQARYKDKEIDIILKRGQSLALIEVKRSSKVIPSQSKWLRDEEFTRMISGKFGNIVKRYVVYTGNTHKEVIDGIEIEYVNASEFLTSYIEA